MVVAVGLKIICMAAAELELALDVTLELDATELDDNALEDDALDGIELEATELLEATDEEATPQLAAILIVVLITTRVLPLITTLVQPLAAMSVAGNASAPQPPLGSILKRGPPPPSPAVKLRQASKLVEDPETAVIKSPAAHALWVPRI